jgi:3-oxoacyl-[acyl-carrier protein] reductase
MSFQNKVAIVTGAAQGMGAAYARLLAAKGAAVVLADIDFDKAADVAAAIAASGGKALAVRLDVADPDACIECARQAVQAFGRIDYLVNNAGLLSAARAAPLPDLPIDEYLRVMAVNTHSCLYMTQAVLPAMKAAGGGAIVNTSSIGAWMSNGVYALSKLAVNGLTINLAHALGGFGIRVNAVAPGTTNTEGMKPLMSVEQMAEWGTKLGRPNTDVAQPEAIATVGIFLLSDEAAYVNGQVLAVDGGIAIRP